MTHAKLGVLAGLCATALWSLKPIYVSGLQDAMAPAEIFFCAGLISLFASCAGFVFLRKDLAKIRASGLASMMLKHSLLAGALLSVWYIAFYKALSGSVSAQATIISFTWPFFAIIAMRLFAPHLQRPLHKREYPLLAIAFLGAAITASGDGGDAHLLIYALVAALGSGFYLPFLSLALEEVGKVLENRLKASFIVVSLANVFSFSLATPVLLLAGISVWPTAPIGLIDFGTLCAIGIGTYLVAELVWCWAICTTKSPAIAALPYFSPAISVIMLGLIADATVPITAVAGLALILSGNLALHFKILPSKIADDKEVGPSQKLDA